MRTLHDQANKLTHLKSDFKKKNESSSEVKKIITMANDRTNWKKRFDAIHKMKKNDCDEVREILIRLALSDRVYKVKKEAYKVANELNIKQNEKPIYLGKKHNGYNLKEFKDQFTIIRKLLNLDKFNMHEFKKAFKQVNPEMYDVMDCEKGKKFDYWIKDIYSNLSKEK